MKIFLNAVLILFVLSQTVMADDRSRVSDLLKGKLDAVVIILESEDLSEPIKKDRIEEIVAPIFDFPLMARLALGRKYWPSLSEEDKARFTELFTILLKEVYLSKIILYTDEKITIEEPLQVKKKIHIPTYLHSKDKKFSILYKLYKSHNNWKIYDIEVQGVSLIRTYRSQFSEGLQDGTIKDLIKKMENMDSVQ